MIKKMKFLAVAFFLMFAAVMQAQVTTSSMSGQVTDADGAVIGATVVATHVPSGTTYGTVTNIEGRYNLNGMRVGGPYNVEVSYIGYAKQVLGGISLRLGENYVHNVYMTEETVALGEIVVTGDRMAAMNSQRMGAAVNIGNREINLMPTVSRSINDITRLTPQANGNQIAGGNYRQNYFTVDGAQFNNAFGIGSNLPGGGNPISIDALDQISVNITPFDVRQSGFIGAAVNAVTKSGTNEFKGSAYTYFTNEKMRGNKVGDATFDKSPAKYNMYGFTIGGPIIKNKLFFFANFETEKSVVPGPSRVAATPQNPADYENNIARPTVAQMDLISKYLQDTYGYDPGPYQGYSNDSPAKRFLTRIDWNINNNHKLNLRYSYQTSKSPSLPSTSYSPFSSLYTGNRLAMDAIPFKNAGYYNESNFSSLSSELNSQLGGGKYRNMFRFTYSHQNDPRSTDGKLFPFVDILENSRVYTSFGTELFSYGNLRDVKTITLTDEFMWTMGIHNMTAGLQYEHNVTKNGFMRFGASYYAFNSWDDFVNGADPRAFAVTFSNTPGYAQAFPSFNFGQYTAYLQDQMDLNEKLRVTAGIRLDLPTYTQPADTHPMLAKLDFNGKKFDSATLPKSRVLLSPRLGFNYDIMGDRSVILRGGTGLFTGRVPFVWIVGQVGDAGMLQTTQNTGSATGTVPYPFNPDPRAYYPATQPAAGTVLPTSPTVIDPDFKLPQTWKTSLGVEAELPWGLRGSLEGIYNKDVNAAFWRNEGLKDASAQQLNISGYPDNRLIYPSNNDKYFNVVNPSTGQPGAGARAITPIVLGNEKGGYYYSVTAKLEKTFDRGFYGMVAYTRSGAKNLVDGFGDQAFSAWQNNPNVNGANSVERAYAGYVMPNKVIANVSYRIEYLKSMASTISLFYDGGAQGRFSYVYNSNIVRDGAGSQNLIYVPKDPSEITFVDQTVKGTVWTAQQQSDAFFAYIDQDKYLSSRKGMYAERNGAIMPWVNTFDLKFMQEFFLNVSGKRNTLQVSFDILNVGNLLNSKWGNQFRYNQGNILVPANVNNVSSTVRPTYRLNPYNDQMLKETFSKNIGYSSTYSMQIGVKYIFN